MMQAIDGLDYLAGGASTLTDDERRACASPQLLAHYMSKPHLHSEDADVHALIDAVFAQLPQVQSVEGRVRLAGWRCEPPQRVVLRTQRGTVLLNERSAAQPVGRILDVTREPPERDVVAQSALATLRAMDPIAETVRRDGHTRHTHTALVEALAAMGLDPPMLHSRIPIHTSTAWTNDHLDARYAETQLADNGARFRDWLVVHADARAPQRCRLDSHTAEADRLFYTTYPWTGDDRAADWVRVASSVEPELRVLAAKGKGDPADRLLASVKARFLQDLKLLPVRDPSHRVERAHTSVYVDKKRAQVMISYAPTGSTRIEFMVFSPVSDI